MENPSYQKAAAANQLAEDQGAAYEELWQQLLETPEYKMTGDLVLELVDDLGAEQWKKLADKLDQVLAGTAKAGEFTELLRDTVNEINTEFAKQHASSQIYGDSDGNV